MTNNITTKDIINKYYDTTKEDRLREERYKLEGKHNRWFSYIDLEPEESDNEGVMYFEYDDNSSVFIEFTADMSFDEHIHSYENIKVTKVTLETDFGEDFVLDVDLESLVEIVEDYICEIDSRDNMIEHTTSRAEAEESVSDMLSYKRSPSKYYGLSNSDFI